MITKVCQKCQQPFEAGKRFARFCHPCRKDVERERKKLAYREHSPTYNRPEIACVICGKSFKPKSSREMYCDDACYQEARRRQSRTPIQRARGARNAARRRERNPEHMRQLVSESRKRHIDQRREDVREWHRQHPEHAAKHSREWRASHPEYKREEHRRYYPTHKNLYRIRVNRRRARVLQAGGSFTKEQFEELCEACNHCCAYCYERFDDLTPDHIIPLSRGGSNDIANIIPACLKCNLSKHTKTPLEYQTRYPLLWRNIA